MWSTLLSVLKTFKAEESHREARYGRSKGANMSTGDEKIAANQLNAKKSTGPRNTTAAPATVDVTVHANPQGLDQFTKSPCKQAVKGFIV